MPAPAIKSRQSLYWAVYVDRGLSRFTGGACGHEGKLIVLIVLLSWRWDLPTPYTLVLRLSTDQG
jgi:hypothetical protein